MTLVLPLVFLAALWGAGAAPAAFAEPGGREWPWWLPLGPFVIGALLLLSARRPALVLLSLVLLSATLGLLRATVGAPPSPPSLLARRMTEGPVVALRGEVVEPPLVGERAQRLQLRVVALRAAGAGWEPATGGAQVLVRPAPVLRAGELVHVLGQAAPPSAGSQRRREGAAAAGRRRGTGLSPGGAPGPGS